MSVGNGRNWWGSDLYGNFWGVNTPNYCMMQYDISLFVLSISWDMSDGQSVRCLKDNVPVLITEQVSNIKATEAVSGGQILINGGQAIKSCGVCWYTSPNPTLKNFNTIDKPFDTAHDIQSMVGIGPFESTMKGLKPNTTYHLRAYATNSLGTAYGNEVTFTTNPK